MTVKTKAEVRGLGDQTRPADIVLVLNGDCDLGWSLQPDGSFAIVADLLCVNRIFLNICLGRSNDYPTLV